jgi:hypothetical protein
MEDRPNKQNLALRQPVELHKVDARAAAERASRHAKVAADLVARLTGAQVNAEVLAKLCAAVTIKVHDGSARQGLRLNGICSLAKVSEGHVREHFTPAYSQAAALTVRLMQSEITTPVIYDLVAGQLADTRETRSLGAVDGGLRHLLHMSVSASTSCVDRIIVLLTGTPHDRSHHEADHNAIEAFEATMRTQQKKYTLPSSFAEHIKALIDPHEKLRDLARRSSRLVASSQLASGTELSHVFPDILVVPTLSVGPRLPDRDVGTSFYPGADPDTYEYVASLRRPALLSLGDISIDPETVEREFPQTEALWQGWRNAFGAGTLRYGVEYRANRRILIRMFREQHPDGYVGISCQGWALVNFPAERRGQAIEICEHRSTETWHEHCLAEYRNRTEPGLLQAANPIVRPAIQATACVGNGANVTWDRVARQKS